MDKCDSWKGSKALVKGLGSHTLVCFLPTASSGSAHPAPRPRLPPLPLVTGAGTGSLWGPTTKVGPALQPPLVVPDTWSLLPPAAAACPGSVPVVGTCPCWLLQCVHRWAPLRGPQASPGKPSSRSECNFLLHTQIHDPQSSSSIRATTSAALKSPHLKF